VSFSTSREENGWRTRANAYYWAVVLPTFARELFHDVDFRAVHLNLIEVHLRLKWQLLPLGDDPDGDVQSQVRSTSVSRMNDEDFKDYLNRLSIFAGMKGIEFPKRDPADGQTNV